MLCVDENTVLAGHGVRAADDDRNRIRRAGAIRRAKGGLFLLTGFWRSRFELDARLTVSCASP
ncbi:hypothetical protein PTKU64_87570 [Paraburkholderia terrae]|uniref:Transposase n=1 Tax=Paraburkholderia terrae TaxID=311230 RepID=A0ABM7U1K5_9BURK|nr:hypothetical protein PTKU64_87570 [Paraburkholderia terrae]